MAYEILDELPADGRDKYHKARALADANPGKWISLRPSAPGENIYSCFKPKGYDCERRNGHWFIRRPVVVEQPTLTP